MDVFILWAQEGYVTDKKKIERLCIALYDKLIPKKVKKS